MAENDFRSEASVDPYSYYIEYWTSDEGESLKSLRRRENGDEDLEWDAITAQSQYDRRDLERIDRETAGIWEEVQELKAQGNIVEDSDHGTASERQSSNPPEYIYWIDRWTDEMDGISYISLRRDKLVSGEYEVDDFYDYNTVPDIDTGYLIKELNDFDKAVQEIEEQGYTIEVVD